MYGYCGVLDAVESTLGNYNYCLRHLSDVIAGNYQRQNLKMTQLVSQKMQSVCQKMLVQITFDSWLEGQLGCKEVPKLLELVVGHQHKVVDFQQIVTELQKIVLKVKRL